MLMKTTYKVLSQALIRKRRKEGLSLAAVAQITGLSRTTLYFIETGRAQSLSPKTREALTAFLNSHEEAPKRSTMAQDSVNHLISALIAKEALKRIKTALNQAMEAI